LAIERLIQLGHRAIGYIGAGNRQRSNSRRLGGYRDALKQAGIAGAEGWVAIAPASDELPEHDVASGQALLAPLLSEGVTAIFCYNDMIAVGVLTACRERGVAVPRELSVVGFDDIEMAKYVTPPLTTLHQPKVRLGRAAMRMLLDLLDDRQMEDCMMPPTLVERGSTASRQPSAISHQPAAASPMPMQHHEKAES
jgi:LacI family transcriptional regulator/LacI family repressor for deo operon, udp, cdd, tsx, nupC, and nupG